MLQCMIHGFHLVSETLLNECGSDHAGGSDAHCLFSINVVVSETAMVLAVQQQHV
jgi:hypothetical protein